MKRIDLFRDMVGKTGAEVGVAWGDFAQELLDLGVRFLFLVDPYRSGYDPNDPNDVSQEEMETRYDAICSRFADAPTLIMRHTLPQVANFFTRLDFIHLDGSHRYDAVYDDLVDAARITDVIIGHDYTDKLGFGVIPAVQDFLRAHPEWKLVIVTDEEWPSYRLEKGEA